MADIFLSHAHEDRELAHSLADALQSHGLVVWWDQHIPAGRAWNEIIGRELELARVVVVLWSTSSVKSTWVLSEADEGRRQRKLIPVVIDDVEVPLGFRGLYAADLREWKGSSADPQFDKLLRRFRDLSGRL